MIALFILLTVLAFYVFRKDIKARFFIYVGIMAAQDKGMENLNKFVLALVDHQPRPSEKKLFFRQLKYIEKKISAINKKGTIPLENLNALLGKIKKRKTEIGCPQ